MDRITSYIESQGTVVPEDVAKYREFGPLYDSCLFCGDVPADYSVKLFGNYFNRIDTPRFTYTGANCCFDCDSQIKEALPDLFEHEKADVSSFSNRARKRLNLFLQGKFDEDVHLYYLHNEEGLTPTDSQGVEQVSIKDGCYFCGRTTKGREDSTLIQVPVMGEETFLTGGYVSSCSICNDYIRREENKALSIDPMYPIEVCVKCHANYLVDHKEKTNRRISKTISKHLCPKCAYEQAANLGSKLKDEQPTTERYISHSCECCTNEFVLDLTMPLSYLEDKHSNNELGIVTCEECPLYEGQYYNDNFPIYTEQLRSGVFARLYFYNGKVILQVKMHEGGPSKSVLADLLYSGQLDDCLYKAHEKLWEIKKSTVLF